MQTKEIYFTSNDGKSRIHAVEWVPENRPKAILQLVHGMAEHIERYGEFATFMAEHGYLVVGDNHLGHGKSVPENGQKGYFCDGDAASVLVRDEHKLHEVVEGEYPGIPYFILGHSMGSFITRNYLTEYGHEVQGAVIMGTGMQSRTLLGLSKTLAKAEKLFKGDRHVSTFIDKLAFGGYYKKIPGHTMKNEWLTSNLDAVQKYNDDPDCGFTFTVNGFSTLFELIWRLHDEERLGRIPRNLPMLFVSGADDPVGNYGKGVKQAVRTVQKAGVRDVTMKLYPGGRHEILNDREHEEVYEDVLSFYEEILAKTI